MATDPKELRERATKVLQADYFAVLGVPRAAPPDVVENAYVAAAKSLHPDRGPAELKPLLTKAFARLDQARSTLVDPTARARYLQELTRPASSQQISTAEAALEFKKGEALLKTHNAAQAEAHLRKAVALAPDSGEYAALLAFARARPNLDLGALRGLLADLDRVLARDPTLERAVFYRAQLRRRAGMEAEALQDFARAAELNPGNIDAAREVRLHKMRTAGSKPVPATAADAKPGFFGRLFKR